MLTFRLATAKDLPRLSMISMRSKAHWGYPQAWLDSWKDDLAITEKHLSDFAILLAEEEGVTVGFCAISEATEYYEVEHLWLLPEQIGKGYGKRLLDEALNKFTTNLKPVKVVADPNAESFYQRQGFETYEQIASSPAGRFLPVMKKTNTH